MATATVTPKITRKHVCTFDELSDRAKETARDHAPNSPANIRKEFPEDKTLHAIADGLDALQFGYKLLTGHRISARITQDSNQYVHKYTMGCTVEDEQAEFGDEDHIDLALETKVLDLMRDFAQWIYDGMEQEYEYRLSDEAIEDMIRENEYTFQAATGKRV